MDMLMPVSVLVLGLLLLSLYWPIVRSLRERTATELEMAREMRMLIHDLIRQSPQLEETLQMSLVACDRMEARALRERHLHRVVLFGWGPKPRRDGDGSSG